MMAELFQTKDLEKRLGYQFADHSLLEAALTHPSLSFGRGKKVKSSSTYERLEFLGDRVLGLVVAQWLYELFPAEAEGDLAKRHAALVNRDALRRVAEEIALKKSLRLLHNDQSDNSRQNLAALSDAMEGVIGAMYLDGGLEPAQRFIQKLWDKEVHAKAAPADPKSALQEWVQGKGLPLPTYTIVQRKGPAHAPVFQIKAVVEGVKPVLCEGKSKREAEKLAAEILLEEIEKR